MPIQLKHNDLIMEIEEPGEVYRGTRFDWTGRILQVRFQDTSFCTRESLSAPLSHQGAGLCNEFGISRPVGYIECAPGEQFPKIGVGLLTRDTNDAYDFSRDYILEPFEFSWTASSSQVDFVCEGRECRGYDFTFRKQISLDESSFSIHYSLSNTGEKNIGTNEYMHNFLAINDRKLGPDYELRFSFSPVQKAFSETVNPENAVHFEANRVYWRKTPEQPFFFSHINASKLDHVFWTLNRAGSAGIQEWTGFPVHSVNLWGHSHVVSPEIFIDIGIAPGETMYWQRNYEILPEKV